MLLGQIYTKKSTNLSSKPFNSNQMYECVTVCLTEDQQEQPMWK